MSVVKLKPKLSQRPIKIKGNIPRSQSELKANTSKRREARENASDQVAIGFSFASDWLKKWREISRPITELSNAKPMQSRITFDTQLKNTLLLNYVIIMRSAIVVSR